MPEETFEMKLAETSDDCLPDPWEQLDQTLEMVEELHESTSSDSPIFDRYAALLEL